MRTPNLFILGYPKTGTTSLHAFLSAAAQVYSLPQKEIGNLETIRSFHDPASSVRNEYLSLFSSAETEQYVIDPSPLYALYSGCGTSIASLNSDAKLVLGLREPFSYIRSMCNQIERNLGYQRLLSQDIVRSENYTKFSYLETVRDLLANFNRDAIYVYVYDDLVADASKIQADLCAFLGLDIPSESCIPSLNKSHKPLIGKRLAVYNYLLHSRVPKAARTFLKESLHLSHLSGVSSLLISALQPTAKADPFLTDQLVSDFKASHKQSLIALSEILDRDLVKLWGYQGL